MSKPYPESSTRSGISAAAVPGFPAGRSNPYQIGAFKGNRFKSDAKAVRNSFVILGPFIYLILGLIPCWNAYTLVESETYIYFTDSQIPIAMLSLALIAATWLLLCFIYGLPACYNPCRACPNIFFACSWCCPSCLCCSAMPLEAWIIIAVVVALVLVWKLIPVLYIGGLGAAIGWLFSGVAEYFGGGIKFTTTLFDVFLRGTTPAAGIMAICVAALCLFVFATAAVLHHPPVEGKRNPASLVAIWAVYALVCGLTLCYFGDNIARGAETAHAELYDVCQTGPRSGKLYEEAEALKTMRTVSACALQVSVEMCEGFKASKENEVLKSMENDFQCSGFCVGPSDSPIPALFSQKSSEVSCDGAAARNMENLVKEVGHQAFLTGLVFSITAFLLWIFITLGLLEHKYSHERDPEKNYGAVF